MPNNDNFRNEFDLLLQKAHALFPPHDKPRTPLVIIWVILVFIAVVGGINIANKSNHVINYTINNHVIKDAGHL